MKKLFTILTIALLTVTAWAQAPEKMNYQGIARDNAGAPLENQALGIRITILNEDGSDAYVETHGATTNGFGLYTLAIGAGNPLFGTMGAIDWAADDKSIKVEIDPAGGSNYTDLGTTELLSVPYALYAIESRGDTGAAGGDLTGTYPNPGIADNAVTTPKINNAAVTAAKLANSAVITAKIGNEAVTDAKLADDAVTTAKINNAAVTAAKLANNAATTAKIANSAVTTAKIADGAVTFDKLATSAQPGLKQGTGTNPGYRRSDATPANYGTLGERAIDLSWSDAAGTTNGATGSRSTAMGQGTVASGVLSTAMGSNTEASSLYSTAMGRNTTASAQSSTAMGQGTVASGSFSIAMGLNTTASAQSSTAIGFFTEASGLASTAMGRGTVASGESSTAMGRNANATHTDSFVISSSGTVISSSAAGQMTMRFYGGYRLFSNSAHSTGVTLAAGGNSWSTVSDSTKKENFLKADGRAFLQKIKTMKLGSWNYIGQDPEAFRHYGPMAQEFHSRFGNDGIGTIGDDTSIATADIDGVMLIAIQALIEENEALKEQLIALKTENKEMKTEFSTRLDNIETALLPKMTAGEPEIVSLSIDK